MMNVVTAALNGIGRPLSAAHSSELLALLARHRVPRPPPNASAADLTEFMASKRRAVAAILVKTSAILDAQQQELWRVALEGEITGLEQHYVPGARKRG